MPKAPPHTTLVGVGAGAGSMGRASCAPILLLASAVAAAACGAPGQPKAATYASVGGTVDGLAGTMVLRNQNIDLLLVHNNGSFVFARPLAHGEIFRVNVASQPDLQTCQVATPTGVVGDDSSQKVSISCSSRTFLLGGSLSQTAAPLVLHNNTQDSLTLTTPGPFVFAQGLPAGARYQVVAEASGQACTVLGGSGVMGAKENLSVQVKCQALPYSLGGTTVGLAPGGQLVLAAAGQALTITANGSFLFSAPALFATPLAAHVMTSPAGQSCQVASPSPQVVAGDNLGLAVSCQTAPHVPRTHFSVGGSLSGARGDVTLSEAASGRLVVSHNGPFAFAQSLANGAAYAVSVVTSPAGQSCQVASGAGSIVGADVGTLAVACTDLPYALGGSLSGLTAGKSLTLSNGSDSLTLTTNGAFVFAAPVLNQATFAVTIAAQPVGEDCRFSGANGLIAAADNHAVAVACRPFLRLASGQSARLAMGQTDLAHALPCLDNPAGLLQPQGIWAPPGGPLYVADSGLHQVAGFSSRPAVSGGSASFTLNRAYPGATDFSPSTQWIPFGIAGDAASLAMADSQNNRVLVWRPAPTAMTAPSLALGQTSVNGTSSGCSATQLRQPFGLSMANGLLAVADSGNHRVLIWRSISTGGQPADVVLGQPDFTTCGPLSPPSAASLSSPIGVWTDGTRLLVADTGNARIVWWHDLSLATDGSPADGVLGQPDFVTGTPNPDLTRRLTQPTGVVSSNGQIWVADQALSRVLGFNQLPTATPMPANPAGDVVLGAKGFSALQGCNLVGGGGSGGDQPCDISLCAPTSLAIDGERLYVTDSANHRVLAYDSL